MNSESNSKAATIIEEVLEKTDEEYLHRRIDEPIEQAAASFEFDRDAPVTHQTFIQVITNFVRHVYEQAHGCWQEMSAKQAYAEAVAILEEGYQTSHGRGYDAAFLDASNPNLDGIEYVVAQITGCIITMVREKHIRGVCASRMELADWPIRRQIAEILQKRWEPYLPDNLRTCSPAQLAHYLSELVNLGLSADRTVGTIRGAGANPWQF